MSELPPLENDRTAMMLGLVPDKRTPEERLIDAVLTGGKSVLDPCLAESPEGYRCDLRCPHDEHRHWLPCGAIASWLDPDYFTKRPQQPPEEKQ